MVQRPGGGDRIGQAPAFEAETPEAAQVVREEQAVVERGDYTSVGGGM